MRKCSFVLFDDPPRYFPRAWNEIFPILKRSSDPSQCGNDIPNSLQPLLQKFGFMDRFFIIKVGVRLHRPALCFQRFLKVPSLVRFFTIYFLATHRLLLICADDVLLIFSAPFAGQRANEAPKLNVGKFCTTAYLDQPGVDYA